MAMDENLLAQAGYRGPKWRVDSSIYGDVPVFNTPVQSVNVPAPLPVQPPMLFFAPHQEDDGGWAGALGLIGGNLLSRLLARRSASSVDGGHTSASHTDEPIIQPHYDSNGVGGEHQMGFARGGVIGNELVGRRLKFGEVEPEAVVDEAGRVQVITKPTVGTPTRPALVVPFSQLKAAAAALGQELPAPDYREIYSGPRWNPSQFEQVDGATRSSLAGISTQKPSEAIQGALQNSVRPSSGPRWPGGLDLTATTSVGQKPLPQSDSPMAAGFKTSAVSPSLALSRDDTHDINQFASPDVRATLEKKTEYGSPAGLSYKGPRWPAADEQTPQSQVTQQSPATSDASTLPVDERRKEIFDASGVTASQSTSSQLSQQSSVTTTRRARSLSRSWQSSTAWRTPLLSPKMVASRPDSCRRCVAFCKV